MFYQGQPVVPSLKCIIINQDNSLSEFQMSIGLCKYPKTTHCSSGSPSIQSLNQTYYTYASLKYLLEGFDALNE